MKTKQQMNKKQPNKSNKSITTYDVFLFHIHIKCKGIKEKENKMTLTPLLDQVHLDMKARRQSENFMTFCASLLLCVSGEIERLTPLPALGYPTGSSSPDIISCHNTCKNETMFIFP